LKKGQEGLPHEHFVKGFTAITLFDNYSHFEFDYTGENLPRRQVQKPAEPAKVPEKPKSPPKQRP
jgi:hypothetical protein